MSDREFRFSMSSAAVSAAIELDNVHLGRSLETDDVRRLAERLAAGAPPHEPADPVSLITPSVLLVGEIVLRSNPGSGTAEAVAFLRDFIAKLESATAETAAGLRDTCLDLGRCASRSVWPR